MRIQILTDGTSGTRTSATHILTFRFVEICSTPLTTAPRRLKTENWPNTRMSGATTPMRHHEPKFQNARIENRDRDYIRYEDYKNDNSDDPRRRGGAAPSNRC